MEQNMTAEYKWTTKDMPDQGGKVVLVTGANSGLGFETSKAMAAKGAEVVMACRNMLKGEAAIGAILGEVPDARLKLIALDLSDLESVKAFAAAFRAQYAKLDILFNNAGVMAIPKRQTAQGFEMQFGTNHLRHYALDGLLINLLVETPNSRVVTISSYAHLFGWMNFKDLNGERFYYKWLAYGQSKLANLLFVYELQRRLAEHGRNTISVAAHPGYAATNLQHASGLFAFLNPIMAQSQEMGALNPLYAATHPDLGGGEYIGPDGFLAQRGYPHLARLSRRSYDEAAAKRLWQVSAELTGVKWPF
jgi:NAD(P)-dependent dehydrogenase (short-subunit alcohol dehydrogenase family)